MCTVRPENGLHFLSKRYEEIEIYFCVRNSFRIVETNNYSSPIMHALRWIESEIFFEILLQEIVFIPEILCAKFGVQIETIRIFPEGISKRNIFRVRHIYGQITETLFTKFKDCDKLFKFLIIPYKYVSFFSQHA